HARGEVAAGRADDHDPPAGHVLATVVPDALNDGLGAGVTDAEPLADHAADVDLAVDRAVADHVAGDDVLLGLEALLQRLFRREDRDLAAGEALANVVVGIAFEQHRHAVRQEAAEALAGRALEAERDRVVRQAGL